MKVVAVLLGFIGINGYLIGLTRRKFLPVKYLNRLPPSSRERMIKRYAGFGTFALAFEVVGLLAAIISYATGR